MKNSSRLSRLQKVGLVSAGVVTGAVITATGFASAVDNTTTPAPSTQSQQSEDTNENAQAPHHPGAPGGRDMNHPAEEALTGDAATKVETAVTAKYPDATIKRMEMGTGDEGAYEAHITKADGTRAEVFLDAGFVVTGEKECGPDDGPGHEGPRQGGPRSEGHSPMGGPGHEGPGHEGPGYEGPRHEGHGGPGDIDDDAPAAPSDAAPSTSTPSA
jgi:hypothetical protein